MWRRVIKLTTGQRDSLNNNNKGTKLSAIYRLHQSGIEPNSTNSLTIFILFTIKKKMKMLIHYTDPRRERSSLNTNNIQNLYFF